MKLQRFTCILSQTIRILLHFFIFFFTFIPTAAFDKAGHSDAAYAMLKDFVIGPAEPYSSTKQDLDMISTAVAETTGFEEPKRKAPRWRTKLFTKEDPIGIHKYMGIFSLLHFAFRYSQMLFGDPSCGLGTRMGKGPAIFAALTVLPHGILSASSLIFHTVPKERVVNLPMIWQEFRMHNIIFGLRSVATTLLAWAAIYKPSVRQPAIVLSALSVMIANAFADVATAKLRDNDAESTTATMPYWEGASIETQRKFKVYYSYCQFLATLACMACANPAWPLCVLLPIQLASLLMTLVRKGLISARAYHIGYTASLCMPFFVGFRTALYAQSIDFPVVMGIGWVLYQLRRKGVSKYLLWAPIVAARIALGDKILSPQIW